MDIPVQKKTKVGTCITDENPSLVRVACALRGMLDDVIQGVGESPGIRNLLEYAAQNTIVEGVSSQEPGIVTTTESVTTCAHFCAHHGKLMDIALWSGLPEEFHELIFAHLPWPQIYRVRILSKGWNQKLMRGAKDSQFKRACVKAQPKSFVLFAPTDDPGSFKLNMFDIASNKWHGFETSPGFDPKRGEIEGVSASDGGLVCILTKDHSKSKKIPWLVSVCNPLTRAWKKLPPLCGIVQQRIMVKLIMDCETMYYRVIVVGYCKGPEGGNVVKVYHSKTGKWTKADGSSSGEVVYGYLHKLNSYSPIPAPCSYSFADGLVHEISRDFSGHDAHESDFLKDHLFRLKDVESGGLPTHCIEEYEAENCGASWTFLKKYPLSRLPRTAHHIHPDAVGCWLHFFACNDFLLIFQVMNEKNRREFLWLYDFSVEEWRELPMMLEGERLFSVKHQLCELRFDSVP